MPRLERTDPLLVGLVGLGLVLLPLIVWLAEAYPSYEERIRRAGGPRPIVPVPEEEMVKRQVRQEAPVTAGLSWRVVYAPDEAPRTGIVRGYDLEEAGHPVYSLIVFRHDIACEICRDVVGGVLYEWATDSWVRVFLFEPFERKGVVVDAGPFLSQFEGQPADRHFVLGDAVYLIDGRERIESEVVGMPAVWEAIHSWVMSP